MVLTAGDKKKIISHNLDKFLCIKLDSALNSSNHETKTISYSTVQTNQNT